jgi:hypothetical protein
MKTFLMLMLVVLVGRSASAQEVVVPVEFKEAEMAMPFLAAEVVHGEKITIAVDFGSCKLENCECCCKAGVSAASIGLLEKVIGQLAGNFNGEKAEKLFILKSKTKSQVTLEATSKDVKFPLVSLRDYWPTKVENCHSHVSLYTWEVKFSDEKSANSDEANVVNCLLTMIANNHIYEKEDFSWKSYSGRGENGEANRLIFIDSPKQADVLPAPIAILTK